MLHSTSTCFTERQHLAHPVCMPSARPLLRLNQLHVVRKLGASLHSLCTVDRGPCCLPAALSMRQLLHA